MASTLADQSSSLTTRSDQHDNTPNDDKQPPKKGSKNKRTKTGCMTCRKRRIKCDETHPQCNNCRKSKRVCSGYQPYTFKQPAGIVRDSFYGNTGKKYSQAGGSNARAQHARSGALPPILPRPSGVSLDQPRPDFRVAPNVPVFAPNQPNIHGVVSQAAQYGTAAGAMRSVPGPLFANPLRTSQSSGYTEPVGYSGTNPPTESSSSRDIPQNTQGEWYTSMPAGATRSAEDEDEGNLSEFDESLGESDYEMEDSGHQTTTTIVPTSSYQKRRGADHAGGVASTTSNALFPYMDYPRDSKIRIEGMKTMFNHFIRITGPTITLYERHPNPVNNKLDSAGKPIVPDGRHFWSYTLPSLSLHHHGLLHAMLALSNVQIANLQDIYPTAAMKHYHLAIHRLGENIISPTRKTHIATLATALLLAYFEVWTSDHSKWCKHLLGARLILLDIPLRRMSKTCWYSRTSQRLPADSGLDVNLLNKITGLRVDYEIGSAHPAYHGPSIQELMTYENYADLYWWYCKMDVYQSILSGRPLMMEYPAWTQCPPRACVNVANDVYGSYDHLVLLLGRVANFTVRDKKRKTEAWRLKRKQPPNSKESPNQYPGILPTTGYIPIPTGFAGPRRPAPQRNEGLAEFETLEEASAQWNEIKEAFSFLKSKLWSKEFKPLGPEFTDNKHSPFGGVIQHSSFAISGFWMNYYMGLICLQRSHPSMPPAPLEAVGMAAKDTAKWASKIARISGGMMEDTSCADVNTISAASLIESSFCLFVAGVQFQNADERDWLVKRMDDTSRLTGFLSARNIADGCETGWQKADSIRQVPVYEKRQDRKQGGSEIRRRSRQAIEQRPAPNSETLMLESADQAFYALGLISVTEDMERVILTDGPPSLDN